ncbi:hypothetical protein [Borrelia coriaceae]|nr:hypothetical protein [Borrelia coriaceae]
MLLRLLVVPDSIVGGVFVCEFEIIVSSVFVGVGFSVIFVLSSD